MAFRDEIFVVFFDIFIEPAIEFLQDTNILPITINLFQFCQKCTFKHEENVIFFHHFVFFAISQKHPKLLLLSTHAHIVLVILCQTRPLFVLDYSLHVVLKLDVFAILKAHDVL